MLRKFKIFIFVKCFSFSSFCSFRNFEMFYEASEIDSLLICNICDQKLQDPRMLPCGETYCNRCIEAVADTDKKRIKCQHCAKAHEIPSEGFPQNSKLNKIIQVKSNEVFRGLLLKDFKNIYESIREKINKIESDLEIGATLIRNHCDKSRDDVQLIIEEAHIKLDEIKKGFLDEIDEYEKECQEQFKYMQQNKDGIDKVIIESKKFLIKSEAMYKKFEINEQEVKTGLDEANKLLEIIEIIKDRIHSYMFKSINLKFDKSEKGLEAETLGRLDRINIDLLFLENLLNLKEIDLTQKFSDFNRKRTFWCMPFQNRHFVCAYVNKNKNFNLALFDRESNIRVERKNVIVNYTLEELRHFEALSSKNITFVVTEEKHSDSKESRAMVRSFDENLNLISTIKQDFYCAYSFDGMLFITQEDIDNDFTSLMCYNSNLELIQKYGQNDENLPFYFPLEIELLLISDKHFIIKTLEESDENDEEITLINKSTGIIENYFYVDSFDRWVIYLNKFIILHSDDSYICFYDFQGNLVKKFILNDNFHNCSLILSFKKELYFLKKSDEKLELIYF